MIESIIIILICIGVLFMILSFEWESLMMSSVTFVIWMGLSISMHQIEIPYAAIQSDDTIVTGVQNIENLYMYGWLFLGLAIIMFLYIISLAFNIYKEKEKRIM